MPRDPPIRSATFLLLELIVCFDHFRGEMSFSEGLLSDGFVFEVRILVAFERFTRCSTLLAGDH